MSSEWDDLLARAGWERKADQFAVVDREALSTPQMVEMSHLVVVDVTGDDASSFLQGQFCNDLLQVSTTQAQLNGYCNPKGRLLALPVIIGTSDGFRLLVPASVKEGFLKRLRMFVMRAAVTINEREDLGCLGLQADQAGSLGEVQASLGVLPVSPMDVANAKQEHLVRWHDAVLDQPRQRYLLVSSMERIKEIWTRSESLEKSDHSLWRLGDISAGIPSITSGIVETFVPQMINLQLIDALSFTKGCYPGQEIVARMQYLGKLKRHMKVYRLPVVDGLAPVAGEKLYTEVDQDAGVIVDAAQLTDDYIALLAVTKVSASDGQLRFGHQAVQSADLPYTLPTLSESDS